MRARPRTLVVALLFLLPGALAAQVASRADLDRDLERLSKGERIAGVPPADSVVAGNHVVPSGTVYKGTIVSQGSLSILGRVEGSAISLKGDVTVGPGASITGDAVAVGGRVIAEGEVLGEMRTMASLPFIGPSAATPAVRNATKRTTDAVLIVAVTFAILLFIALGVLLFAGRNLDEVVGTLETKFVSAFWYGLIGQAMALPVLLVLILALVLSLIGILLIPFAIVAYAIAAAGLVTLGFLAVARLIGNAIWRREGTERGRALGALAVGVALFFALWMVGALLTWAPLAATVFRAAAFAATWSAMTLGLGAAILSRAGSHRKVAGQATRSPELAVWQTPTPVAGVVAARRVVAAREAH